MKVLPLKTCLLLLIVCYVTSIVSAQEILYVFPDSIEKLLAQQVGKYRFKNEKERVYLSLDRNEEIYLLRLGTYYNDRDDDLTRWIKGSNRVGLVNTMKYPLLLDMDFDFGAPDRSAVGTFGKREGETKRIQVLMHGYYVRFNKNGKVLEEYLDKP